MPGRAQMIAAAGAVIAAAGAGYLLLTPDRRARLRTTRGPGSGDYATTMVDRRHLPEVPAPAQPGRGTTAAEVAVEFYEENPPA